MDINKDIAKRVIAGEASDKEAKEVLDWFTTEEGGECLDSLIQADADAMSDNHIKAWADDVPDDEIRSRFYRWFNRSKRRRIRLYVAAAAIIPIIILSAVSLFIADKTGLLVSNEYVDVNVGNGQKLQVALADGTIVNLNSGSHLRYPKHFALFHRDVELAGEGYFSVAKDKSSPFTVNLGAIKIKVTGTRFNVEAYPEENHISVMLDQGSVSLQTQKDDYAMKHGQFAVYDKRTGKCSIGKPSVDSSPSSWQTNTLYFHQVALSSILKEVERQRNIHFIVADSDLLHSRFTLFSKNESVDQILTDIETVSNVCFTRQKNNVSVYVVTQK